MMAVGCRRVARNIANTFKSIEKLRTVLVKVNKLSRAEVPIVSDDEMMEDLDIE